MLKTIALSDLLMATFTRGLGALPIRLASSSITLPQSIFSSIVAILYGRSSCGAKTKPEMTIHFSIHSSGLGGVTLSWDIILFMLLEFFSIRLTNLVTSPSMYTFRSWNLASTCWLKLSSLFSNFSMHFLNSDVDSGGSSCLALAVARGPVILDSVNKRTAEKDEFMNKAKGPCGTLSSDFCWHNPLHNPTRSIDTVTTQHNQHNNIDTRRRSPVHLHPWPCLGVLGGSTPCFGGKR